MSASRLVNAGVINRSGNFSAGSAGARWSPWGELEPQRMCAFDGMRDSLPPDLDIHPAYAMILRNLQSSCVDVDMSCLTQVQPGSLVSN